MSIACQEVSLYPDDLLEPAVAAASARQWWAVYTKSRQEKAFARQLLGRGIPYYLPLVLTNHASRGRRFSAHVPLFASYVFMCASEQERIASLTTNRVSRILAVPNAVGMVHDLRQVFRLIASGAPLTIEQRLAAGRRVRIRHGSLAGLEGTVLARRGGTRLLVAVDFLQQGASIDVEDHWLEPVD